MPAMRAGFASIDIGNYAIEQSIRSDFGQGHAFAAGAVAQDRGGATQGQRHRNHRITLRKRQYRFHLPGQFVIQQQGPATTERPTRLLARHALRLPFGIERAEEVARDRLAVERPCVALRVEPQAGAIGRQQQVPAALRRARGDGLEQQRIARRRLPVQREQVGVGGQRAGSRSLLRASFPRRRESLLFFCVLPCRERTGAKRDCRLRRVFNSRIAGHDERKVRCA